MDRGANAAWDQEWALAQQAYQQALATAPNDVQALAGLALSQFELDQWREALETYWRVSKLVPGDPLPHEKMAEIYRATGNETKAAHEYQSAAEIYFSRGDMQRAIPNWEHAVRLAPDLAKAHMRLALAYEQNEATHAHAVVEYLHVAAQLQKLGQMARAEQALRRARKLDPLDPTVRIAIDDISHGRPIQSPPPYAEAPPERPAVEGDAGAVERTEQDELLDAIEETRDLTAVEKAVREALGELADAVWAGQVPPGAQQPLLRALDSHQVGDVGGALEGYTLALADGFDHPALRFNRGALYQQAGRMDDALDELAAIPEGSPYGMAISLLLGEAHYAQDDLPAAADYLLKALREADRQLNPGQTDEPAYAREIATLPQTSLDHQGAVARALAAYLSDPAWQQKLGSALQHYAEQNRSEYLPALLELMIEGGTPEVGFIMERVEDYLQRDLIRPATEEIYFAIGESPEYLPAHRRLADVLLADGRAEEAAHKIQLIADTYEVRGNGDRATNLYREAISLWPADTVSRKRIIQALREQGQVSEALHHYAELARLYYNLHADPDQTIATYVEALQYADEAGAAAADRVPILRALADVESQRLNWQQALGYFEEAARLDPGNAEVALAIVDLYFQLREPREAIQALDNYLRHCVMSGNMEPVAPVLEEQVRQRPQVIPLRQRLAEVYRQQGRTAEAIAQMDALGELQLDAHRVDAAMVTIQRIIDLNPPDVDGYRQLLDQLRSEGQ